MDWLTDNKIPIGKWAAGIFDWLQVNGAWFFDGLSLTMEALIDGILWVLQTPHPLVIIAAFSALTWGLQRNWKVVAFVILGISIGAGMTAETTQMLLQLPLAFMAVAVATILALAFSWWALMRLFGFDLQSGLLAASPGHLSFVLSIGAQYNLDMARITIVQSIRLLALTLLTPLAARAMGITAPSVLPDAGAPMTWTSICLLAVVAYAASLVLQKINTPAPLPIRRNGNWKQTCRVQRSARRWRLSGARQCRA